jgi:N-acetyl sugar amidotransferase
MKTMYDLPEEVVFCKRCVMSNQRPASMPEYQHQPDRRGARYLHIDEEGVCDACRVADRKEEIDWQAREAQLLQLLDRHRRDDGTYDCIVPGSGGKDSAYAAHVLKHKYGMHPLTVTWAPTIYTDYGWKNFTDWIEIGGFDNVLFKPSGRVHRLLTQLAVRNLLHPFQTFILGQKFIAVKASIWHQVPLVFYGESEAEYGNPKAEASTPIRDKAYHAASDLSGVHLAGVPLPVLMEQHGLSRVDLAPYLPADTAAIERAGTEVHYLGYYLKWTPQEAYYYAVENTGFTARPFRSEGTYSKYNSVDDKIDDLHYYTTYIKFGLGRASYDASQEIRNHHLTREEGVALVRKFDGEYPERYMADVLDYLELTADEFRELCDAFRPPHLWEQRNGEWVLRHPVS